MRSNLMQFLAHLIFLFKLFKVTTSQPSPAKLVIEELSELKYSTLTKFYLYVDLSGYKEKEEAILTLNSLKMTELKKFNAKYISGIALDKIMENMPTDATVFKATDSQYEGYKFLYFQKRDSATVNSYLLVYIELESALGSQETASIVLCDHETTSYVTKKTQYARAELGPFIPKILKYLVVKDVDFGNSYFFYFPLDGYQTVYEGELLDDSDAINVNKTVDRLITFTFPSDQPIYYNINITIVLFGPKITATLEIWNTFSSVLSFHERKEDKMIHMEVSNSFNPFYILGSYKKELNSLIYFEKLSGDFSLYYKDYINGVELRSVLPTQQDRTGTRTYIKASKKNDLIMGECVAPCSFNIHFISNPQPTEIAFGEKVIVYLMPDKELTITAPESTEAMNVEILNIEEAKALEVNVFGTAVPSFDYVHRQEYKTDQPKTIKLKSKTETIVAITLGTNNKYIEITSTEPKPSQYSIYYFEKDLTVSSIQIDLSNLDAKKDIVMSYKIGYGLYPFTIDPTKLVKVNLDTSDFSFANPYLQDPPFPNDIQGRYYFLMKFSKQPNLAFEVTKTQLSHFASLPEKKVTKISNLETFQLSPVGKGRSFVFYITKCSKEESIVKFKYGKDTISGLYVTKQFTSEKYDYPFNYLMTEFGKSKNEEKYPGVLFYYAYPTIAEAAAIQFNDDFDIHYFDPNDNSTEVELQFTSPLLKKQSYDVLYNVYVYHEANQDAQYDICKAFGVLNRALELKSKELNVKLKMKLNRTEENHVFITAMPTEGISPLFSYGTIHFKSIKPVEKGMSYVWYIVFGLGGVIVVLCIVFAVAYKMKKTANKPIDPLSVPNEALIEN